MHRLLKTGLPGPSPQRADLAPGLPDWLVVQSVTAAALVATLLVFGAPIGSAIVGAWLMSGLVSLGIVKAAVDLAR